MDRIICRADLHLHGLYSGGVSKQMIPKTIAEQAPLKGLNLVGTADILNARWLKLVREQLKQINEGILEHENGTKFVLQTEVEDSRRVHHIIFFPSFSKVDEVRERLIKKCSNLDADGRPRIWLNAEEIAEVCIDAGCMIGPSHAFTPWTAMFKEYNSIEECYGSCADKVHFLELGLSADTNMADRIKGLHRLTFLSNSDGHSPWANKQGREFNEFSMREISYEELAKAITNKDGNRCTLNVGLNPLEGKYHKSRCIGCLEFFDFRQGMQLRWRCPHCGKPVKKGVADRIDELADTKEGVHPEHRPPYKHIIPLNEIIALALDINLTTSPKVQTLWRGYVDAFGSEIDVLLKTDLAELKKVNEKVAEFIGYFRDNKIRYIPGGAGVYGKLLKPGEKEEKKKQKSLNEF